MNSRRYEVGNVITIRGRGSDTFEIVKVVRFTKIGKEGLKEESKLLCVREKDGQKFSFEEDLVHHVIKSKKGVDLSKESDRVVIEIDEVEQEVINALLDEINSIEIYRDIMEEPDFLDERITEIHEELSKYNTGG